MGDRQATRVHTRRGNGELEGLEPVSPGAPLDDHLVVITTDSVDRLAGRYAELRIIRRLGGTARHVPIRAVFRTGELLLDEEVEDGDGARLGGLCEDVTGEEEGIFVWIIPDRTQ